jgi:hypothetical protein
MLVGVQLTLLAALAWFWQAELVSVVLAALKTFVILGGYRFD